MTTHKTTVRKEYRYGMRTPEYRVTCSCGKWQDKAANEATAIARGKEHEDRPSR